MPSGYQHLTLERRSQINALLSNGFLQFEIANSLKVSASTISREVRRNKGERGYQYQQANKMATERRYTASNQPTRMTPEVIKIVEEKLREKWSPEQISGRLALQNILVSHETIYLHIWKDKGSGGTLYKNLRHSGKKYNRRSSSKAGRGCIPERVDITERPAIVEAKSRLGDWEGDTIVGAKQQGAILSLVDRKSKFTLLAKLEAKTAKNVVKAAKKCFKQEPKAVAKTITFDNGKEFSAHKKITKAVGASCYFATPYRSWERGLNEHTNGLVRQYLPKSTNFLKVPAGEIKKIENQLNDRPRKILNYLTPREVFQKFKKPMSSVLHI
jgi:transposase, IS30 family